MIKKKPWFDRQFPVGLPADLFPVILERLRGTPARLEDRLKSLSRDTLTRRLDTTWSIQENAGHLFDLEPLMLQRVEDFVARRSELTAADLENRRTHLAKHNAKAVTDLLDAFRRARTDLVTRLEAVEDVVFSSTALHPRLLVPMNLVDHLFFVAEHDDYHLARITEILRA